MKRDDNYKDDATLNATPKVATHQLSTQKLLQHRRFHHHHRDYDPPKDDCRQSRSHLDTGQFAQIAAYDYTSRHHVSSHVLFDYCRQYREASGLTTIVDELRC